MTSHAQLQPGKKAVGIEGQVKPGVKMANPDDALPTEEETVPTAPGEMPGQELPIEKAGQPLHMRAVKLSEELAEHPGASLRAPEAAGPGYNELPSHEQVDAAAAGGDQPVASPIVAARSADDLLGQRRSVASVE